MQKRQDTKPRPVLFSGLNSTLCILYNKLCYKSSLLRSSQELQHTVVGQVSPHPDQTQPGLEAMICKKV